MHWWQWRGQGRPEVSALPLRFSVEKSLPTDPIPEPRSVYTERHFAHPNPGFCLLQNKCFLVILRPWARSHTMIMWANLEGFRGGGEREGGRRGKKGGKKVKRGWDTKWELRDYCWYVFLALATCLFSSCMGYPHILVMSCILRVCVFVYCSSDRWFLSLETVLPILNNLRKKP